MELRDRRTGHGVTLALRQYQYPGATDDLDANWLIVHGKLTVPGESWSFTDPCLMVGEAAWLGNWLERLANRESRTDARDDDFPAVSFTEPNIGFSCVAIDDAGATLRLFLDYESGPPSRREADDDRALQLDVVISDADLRVAADAWKRDLARFPLRGLGAGAPTKPRGLRRLFPRR